MAYTVYSTSATTLQETLLKEQVSDLMSNLFPLDMPLHQVLEQMPLRSVMQEFPVDTFSTSRINRVSTRFGSAGAIASTTSAKAEAATYSDLTPEQYAGKIRGVAEIQGEQFSVSGTDRAVDQYAIADRFAYEALKSTQSIGNMFEHSFWWSPGTVVGGADVDSGGGTYWVRQTQGLVPWVFKTGLERSKIGVGVAASFVDGNGNEFGTNNTALSPNKTWAYDAAGATLDQAMFKQDLMANWYDISGIQSGAVGFTGAIGKNLFSQFALTANGPINERTLDAAAKLVTDTVDYFETDFGVVSINLCRYLNISGQSMSIAQSTGSTTVPYNEVLLFIKPQYYKIGVLRPVHMTTLGKTGDFERGLVLGEMGLFCKNTLAGAGICNFVP